tara:strand:- start:442 stop:660 length:219 start_codon:yes stop_codon:yes gene_type:complete
MAVVRETRQLLFCGKCRDSGKRFFERKWMKKVRKLLKDNELPHLYIKRMDELFIKKSTMENLPKSVTILTIL